MSASQPEGHRALPGRRQTRQRRTVFEVIRRAAGPLTVPEIHRRARAAVSSIGKATVYRTVRLLQEENRVEAVTLPDGDTRYELAGLGHHHHFQCRKCDEVYDLEACPVEVPEGGVMDGFWVEAHELTLFGLCPRCEPGRPR